MRRRTMVILCSTARVIRECPRLAPAHSLPRQNRGVQPLSSALPAAVGQVSSLLADSGYISAANVNACSVNVRNIAPLHHSAAGQRHARATLWR